MLRHIRWEGASEEEDEGGVSGQSIAIVSCHSDGTALQLIHVSLSMSIADGGGSLLLKGRNKQLGEGQRRNSC